MGKLIKLFFLLGIVALIATGVVFAREWYAENAGENVDTPAQVDVTWEDVPTLLKSGEVKQVTQLHNLTVYITLDNGTRYTVTEPQIDAIFREIDTCGAPCTDIIVATE